MYNLIYTNHCQGNITKYRKFATKQLMDHFIHAFHEYITIIEKY